MNVLCFGNEHFPGDEVAKVFASEIKEFQNFKFIPTDSPHQILKQKGNIIILDVVQGIKEVQLLTVDDLATFKSSTAHDADLGFYLKLLTEVGNIENVKIIGLPFGEKDMKKLKNMVFEILKNL
ncbi:MAG: hypothetical protein OEL89_02375 [Candidatus Peregrinibacteria bacterium]|nr:hypothetical protein [Candidatus Peregrinibacteria bacterium]